MIDLKNILIQHPNCLSSRAAFKSILMDTYPDEKRVVNILTILFECGIAQKIKNKPVLGENDVQAILLQLENDYGIVSKYSNESIRIWANAFDVTVQTINNQSTTPVVHEPIVHAPIVEHVIIEGSQSDYETKLENGALTIIKFVGFDEKEIIVPNCIDGVNVKVIGEDAFANCTGVEKIVISEGITEILNGAFYNCKSLKDIILPSSLQKIGNVPPTSTLRYSWSSPFYHGVFSGCAIETIELPADLHFIGGKAFYSCDKLRKINLPNKVKTIEEWCFCDCYELKEVLLPDNLNCIESNAFSGTGITKIDIPVSTKKIGQNAFKRCEKLTQVLLHEGLTTIEDFAFEDCKLLHSITIPQSVTSIGKQLFDITGWYQPSDRRKKGWSTRNKNNKLIISCYAGSSGLEYARKEGYQIQNAAK